MKKLCILGMYSFDYQGTKGKCNDSWVAESTFLQFLGRQGLVHMVQVGEDLLLTEEPIGEVLVGELDGILVHKDMVSTLMARGYTITNYDIVKDLLIDGKYDLVRGLQCVDTEDLTLEDFKASTLS